MGYLVFKGGIQNQNIDFWPKLYLILYPSLENSTTHITITIISITDIIAFGVGGTTILPALSSFCIYASVGIIATYFFQCTFFVACMSLDVRRAGNFATYLLLRLNI